MAKRAVKPKLASTHKTSLKMVLPLVALSVITGIVLVVSSFAAAVYPSSYMNNLYSQAYARGIDSSGLKHWQSYFQANGCSGSSLAGAARTVYTSSEFAGKVYNNGEVVNRIYGGALQRNPDPSGYNHWVGRLNAGVSRSSVANAIINGGQGEINTIASRVCAAPVAPKPTTPTTPKPTTPSKPKPTTSKPSTTSSTPAASPTNSDTQKPGKASEFTATLEEESSGVLLEWQSADDNVGVASYKLERSTDNTNWTTLDDTIADTAYEDRTVVFSTTYHYRLTAVDAAGNAGEAVTTEVKTGDFSANTSADEATAIASEDNVVIASFPAGAVPEDSSCTVTKADENVDGLTSVSSKQLLVTGPYAVSCKDDNGEVVASFSKPVTITMAPPKASTKGKTKFVLNTYDLQAEQWAVAKTDYDKKAKTYKTSIESPSQVALTGQKAANYLPLIFSIIIPTLLVGGGAYWYYQRKLQKQQYADYIKKKYYNL